jgi:Methyltransferase domain
LKQFIIRFIFPILPFFDFFFSFLVLPSALILKTIRYIGVQRLPLSKKVLLKIGVFPIRNHYYEPLFDSRYLKPLNEPRELPGIDWNMRGQIDLLEKLEFSDELKDIGRARKPDGMFYMDNGSFESGDAEFLYNMIRLKKPKRIFEIGSGYSTLITARAIKQNKETVPGYQCKHLCVEPYERPWLESVGVKVLRQKVEDVDSKIFSELEEDDLLFIDSSHIIRPQGDVVFEYLQLLPVLKKGVIVHVHDIFSPRDYPKEWVIDAVRFWNEQYLLEAFLTSNSDWRILASLNYLRHAHFESLHAKCPFLTADREPGSFYIQRN